MSSYSYIAGRRLLPCSITKNRETEAIYALGRASLTRRGKASILSLSQNTVQDAGDGESI